MAFLPKGWDDDRECSWLTVARSLPIKWLGLGLLVGLMMGTIQPRHTIPGEDLAIIEEAPTDDSTVLLSDARGFAQWEALVRLFHNPTLTELEHAYTFLALPRSTTPNTRQRAVTRRALQLDPEGWLRWLAATHGNESLHFDHALCLWGEDSPEAAWAYAKALGHEHRSLVLTGIAESEPALAITLAEEYETGNTADSVSWKAFQTLIQQDFPSALALAKDAATDRAQRARLYGIIAAWTERSPDEAWAWITSELHGAARYRLMKSAVYSGMKKDPAWAWERAQSMPESGQRTSLMVHVLAEQAKQDPNKAKAIFLDYPAGPERDELLAGLLAPFHNAPRDLLAFVSELRTLSPLTSTATTINLSGSSAIGYPSQHADVAALVSNAIRLISQEDPQEALAWAGRLNAPSSGILDTINQWATTAPTEALAWLVEIPDREFRADAIKHAWQPLMEAAPQSLWEILPSLDANVLDLLDVSIQKLALQDPSIAQENLAQLHPGPSRRAALSGIAHAQLQTDPANAISWLVEQSSADAIGTVLQGVTRSWVLESPEAASRWIASMNPGPERDDAVGGLVAALITDRHVGTPDVEAASAWTSQIEHAPLRQVLEDRLASLVENADGFTFLTSMPSAIDDSNEF